MWCGITEIFGFECVEGSIEESAQVVETRVSTTIPPSPEEASQWTASTTPEGRTVYTTVVENNYITNNPTTIIREYHSSGGGGDSDGVSRDLFRRQIEVVFENIGENIDSLQEDLAEAVNTITLAVSGNASVGGNLDVVGTLTAGILSVSGLSSGSAIEAPYFHATSTTATSTLTGGLVVDTNTLVVDYANSRVGIGTTSPTQKLEISGGAFISGTLNTYGGLIQGGGGGSTFTLEAGGTNQNIVFKPSGTGSVQIGQTPGRFGMDIDSTHGVARITTSLGGNTLTIRNSSLLQYAESSITFADNSSNNSGNGRERMAIGYDNNGNNAPFSNSNFIEFSNDPFNGPSLNAPTPGKIIQTGYLNGSYSSWARQEFASDGTINFYDLSGDPSLKILLNGNVGISSSSPSQKLSVLGNSYVSGFSYVGQYVGIGTTNPSDALHILGGNARIEKRENGGGFNTANLTMIRAGANGTDSVPINTAIGQILGQTPLTGGTLNTAANIYLYQDGSAGASQNAGRIEFGVNNGSSGATTRMTLDSNGALGIGTTTPGTGVGGGILDVFGRQSFHTSLRDALWIDLDGSTQGNARIQTGLANGSNGGALKLNPFGGTVSIGTTTPSAQFSITQSAQTAAGGFWLAASDNTDFRSQFMNTSGVLSFYGGDTGGTLNTATLNAAGEWTNASDIAYKEQIENLSYGLDAVLALQPRSYDIKNTNDHRIGFIAQEVEKVIPEVVGGKEGSKGISYGNLVAVAIKAIQELSATISGFADSMTTAVLNATNINADKVDTKTLCLDEVCITKTELIELLDESDQDPAPTPPAPEPEESNTDTPPEEEPPADKTITEPEPPAEEPIPEPEEEPAPEPTPETP